MKNGEEEAAREKKRGAAINSRESGVHLGNGQRIRSEPGHRQFHYPLHPHLRRPPASPQVPCFFFFLRHTLACVRPHW